jgi:epoxyqueuosine reductase
MLEAKIKNFAQTLGFVAIGITDTDLSKYKTRFLHWVHNKSYANMDYMQRNVELRLNPAQLLPGTRSIIVALWPYPNVKSDSKLSESNPSNYFAAYSLGRDYHRLIRKKLQQLANYIQNEVGDFTYRAYCDSAPVLERALAHKAGLGWVGKNTCLLNDMVGSYFFLGELYTNLDLSIHAGLTKEQCGKCIRCIKHCPTGALTAHSLDVYKCISYLTIEHKGVIPEELRSLIGVRIFGCDECQKACPFNSKLKGCLNNALDVDKRKILPIYTSSLLTMFNWSEAEFKANASGSVITRLSYECWLRNIAIALGNSKSDQEIITNLKQKLQCSSDFVNEHIAWALKKQLALL